MAVARWDGKGWEQAVSGDLYWGGTFVEPVRKRRRTEVRDYVIAVLVGMVISQWAIRFGWW